MRQRQTSQLWFKLSPDAEARSTFVGPVTREAVERMIRLLEVSRDAFPAAPIPESSDG
jgi:hypothetical protein